MSNIAIRSIARQIRDLNVAKYGYTAFFVDDTNGSDSYTGESWDQAFKTIQHAVDTADSWCKIFIKAGTYAENVTIAKQAIHIIGEKEDTVILSPASGDAVTISSNTCIITGCKLLVSENAKSGVLITGDSNIVRDCIVGLTGAFSSVKGCRVNGDYNITDGVTGIMSAGGSGTVVKLYGSYNEVKNCFVDDTNSWNYGIETGGGDYNSVHDNTVRGCAIQGINVYLGVSVATVFHNNLIGNTAQMHNAGTMFAFENFFDDHTTDSNNDGLCDTTYTFTGGADYQPVSHFDGWKQESLASNSVNGANPFVLKGIVTTATDSTHFASTSLVGYGNDAFKDWEIYVFYDTAGNDSAPQGEKQPISGYVSSTGTFTHTAFTADLAVGDEVLILHPYEATGGDATEAKQDIIIANQAGEETISSYNLPNDVAENIAIEVTTTKRLKLDSVWLDFVNLVQDVTIGVHHKIDGSTYRQYDEFSWATTEEDGILLRDITINGDWKLTVTSTVAQGAIKAIPYDVIKTTMEA